MAATVEGAFKIIDMASRPMKRMEDQAKRTDKAIERLGDRLDDVGTNKQMRQMDQVDRNLRSIDRDARSFSSGSGGGGRLRSTLRGAGDDSDRLSMKLARVGAALAGVGRVLSLLKLPLLVSGVVALVQGIGALGGGLVALMPRLVDVVGVLGALPATLTGIGIAAVGAKLALSGIGPALQGTKGAMADLTPRAQQFVRVLKELKPLGQSLRNSAQAGLFPGLTSALKQLTAGGPTARRLLKSGGETLGGIANRAAGEFTQGGFLRDFETIGQQGLSVLNRLGSALINVVQALRHVAISARPFTNWLSETVLGWSQMWEESAKAGRQTGSLRQFFDRSRNSLEGFGAILSNLWGTFRGLGKAARPLGEDLWESAERATARWDRFANSVVGQMELRNYFDSLKENLHAIFEFTGELGKALMRLGASDGFEKTAKALTDAIAPLESAFETIGSLWGPKFAVTLEQLIRLFDNLASGTSGLAVLVDMMNLLLEAINGMLEMVPGLSNLLTAVLGVATLTSLANRIRSIALSWGLVATSAGQAAVAQRAAATAGGVMGGVAGRPGPIAKTPYGPMPLPVPYTGGGKLSRFGKGLGATSLLFGAMQGISTPGDMRTRATAALSGATFGLIPARRSEEEITAAGSADAARWSADLMGPRGPRGIGGWTNKIGKAQAKIRSARNRDYGWRGSLPGGSILGGMVEEEKAQNDVFIAQLQKQVRLWRQIRVEKSKALGSREGNELRGAYEVRRNHGATPLEALEQTLDGIPSKMRGMNEKSQQELLRTTSVWARAIAKGRPKMMEEVEQLERGVESSFDRQGRHISVVNGNIMRGTAAEWKNIRSAMSDEAEKARQEVSTSFTKLQQMAVGSLTSMGYTPAQARKIIGGADGRANKLGDRSTQVAGPPAPSHGGGKGGGSGDPFGVPTFGNARGGRVQGFGNQDRTHLGGGNIAAAGELIVNKHTERDVNGVLGMFGTSLGGMVGKEGRPHSELTYARGGRAGGGIEGVGQWASSMGLSVGEGPGFGGGVPSAGHASGSLHYSGNAYDISGSPALMSRFRRAAEARYLGRGLNELFYDPYPYYIDAGAKVPGAIGDHSDHVHIGFNGGGPSGANAVKGLLGGMGGAGGFKALKAPRSGLGGVPGAMSNAAMGGMTAGLNAKLAAKAGVGMMAAPGGGGVGGKVGDLSRYNRSYPEMRLGQQGPRLSPGVIEQIASWAGLPPLLFRQIALGESSYYPGMVGIDPGGTEGLGMWMITTGYNDELISRMGGRNAMLNPLINAKAAKSIYDSQGVGAWYGTGHVTGAGWAEANKHAYGGRAPGFAGWFANGGSVTASSPTLLGIGDGPGTEVAEVRPKGQARAGALGGVRIGQMKIENHRPGDIRKQVKREVTEAFDELADELGQTTDTDPDEVM